MSQSDAHANILTPSTGRDGAQDPRLVPPALRTRSRVAHHPGVLDGEAVIEGTRIPVRTVVLMAQAGFDAPRIVAELPTLTVADVAVALAYYDHYHDEIDAAIAADAHADDELL